MTAQAWLQIAFYVAVLTALVPLLGAYMARVYQGERVALSRLFGPVERADLPRARHRSRRASRAGRATPNDDRLLGALLARAVPDPALAGHPLLQPDRLQLGAVGRHLQHDVLVHHQHELAVLRRRDDDVVPVADGRAGGAELRLGSGRHGRDGGRDPRLRAAQRSHARQLLGRRDAHAALHPAAAVVHRRARCSCRRA